jgi:hypothetical protein
MQRRGSPRRPEVLSFECGIRKNRRILPQKFLDLIETSSLDSWSCFAMADDIRCDEVVKRIRLTAVPCLEKTPDYGLVLLRRCAHSEVFPYYCARMHLNGHADDRTRDPSILSIAK